MTAQSSAVKASKRVSQNAGAKLRRRCEAANRRPTAKELRIAYCALRSPRGANNLAGRHLESRANDLEWVSRKLRAHQLFEIDGILAKEPHLASGHGWDRATLRHLDPGALERVLGSLRVARSHGTFRYKPLK